MVFLPTTPYTIVTEGIFQGDRPVKGYVQDICTHPARIDNTDEDKRSYLVLQWHHFTTIGSHANLTKLLITKTLH